MKELSTKASILQHIYTAKRAHKEWVRKADKLVNGLDGFQGGKVTVKVDKTFIPLESSSCEFGQWFNAHLIHLAKIPSVGPFVKRIEQHHNQLHETYANIYAIFFVLPHNRSLIHKIFTLNSKKVSSEERKQAKIYFNYLKRSSNELMEVISVLEEKIKSIEYNELKKVIEEDQYSTRSNG
jgi:hypothetical protein